METDERYPKCLCENCKRKLDRLKNSRESKAEFNKDYKAAMFLPHYNNYCETLFPFHIKRSFIHTFLESLSLYKIHYNN